MPKFTSKGVILVASEGGNYGTAPTLDANNYKGLVVYDPRVEPVAGRINRNPKRDSFTPVAPLIGRKSVNIRFGTELKGTGSAANPGDNTVLHDLLKACGMATVNLDWGDNTQCSSVWWCELEVADNAHKVVPYQSLWVIEDPGGSPVNKKAVVIGLIRRKATDSDSSNNDCLVLAVDSALDETKAHEIQADSSGAPSGTTLCNVSSVSQGSALMPTSNYNTIHNASVSIAGFVDDILHMAPGAIGTFSISLQDGEIPRIDFTMSCLWNAPEDRSVPQDVSFLDHLPPRTCKEDLILAQNGGTSLTNIIKPNFSRWNMDIGNSVTADRNLNAVDCAGEFFITERSPQIGIDPLVESLSTWNPWSAWSAGSERVMTLSLGSDIIGNRVSITIPKAVYDGLSYQDRDGRYAYDMRIVPTGSKDDELIMIFG